MTVEELLSPEALKDYYEELMDKIKRRNPGFNPFTPKPGEEELAKAYWAAHWATNPSGGELYEGEL